MSEENKGWTKQSENPYNMLLILEDHESAIILHHT